MDRPMPQCTATTRAGQRCKNHAVAGSDPPRCSSHGGGHSPVGAPPGNTNAQTHGAYTRPLDPAADLDARISDLNHRIEQLSAFIDRASLTTSNDGDSDDAQRTASNAIDLDQYTRLLSLHGQLTSRLGRLMRDRQTISPEDNSFLQECINEALDEVSEILGVKL